MFDFKISEEATKEFYDYTKVILREGFLADHTYCRILEDKLKIYIHAVNSASFSSATSALFSAFSLLPEGKNVLMQTNTFAATAQAVHANKLNITFFDIQDTLATASITSLKETYEYYIKKGVEFSAVVVVPINGFESSESQEIRSFCDEKNLKLIYDNSQGFGSTFDGQFVGALSDRSVVSFHLTKVLTGGEGGMLFNYNSSDKENFDNEIKGKYFGLSDGIAKQKGLNGKMSEFNAALALSILNNDFDYRSSRRENIHNYFDNEIKSETVCKQAIDPKNRPSFYKSVWRTFDTETRMRFENYCLESKIKLTGKVYEIPLHKHTLFSSDYIDCKNSELFGETHFCLPNFPELEDDQLYKIVQIINKFD